MAKKLVFKGTVDKDGNIVLPSSMRQQISEAFKGLEITVTVARKRKKRSTKLNSYYWGACISAILERMAELGNAVQPDNKLHRDELHEYLKNKFVHNGTVYVGEDGVVFEFPPSTAELDNSDFQSYLKYVRDWAHETLGLWILEPGEQAEIKYT